LHSGHADGTGALARCFYSGRGVPKDDALALSLASSSAECGSAYGQYVLGAIYFNGDCGKAASDSKAAELWELAARQGHIASADWLSVLYAKTDLIVHC
jgi:TPR repeat protein